MTPDEAAIVRQAKTIRARESKARRQARPKQPPRVIQQRVEPAKDGRQRQPRLRDKAYLGWVAGLPCLACYVETSRFKYGVHVAHVRFADAKAGWKEPGMQAKPGDDRTAPLCPHHHIADQHAGKERAFWQRLGVSAPDFCRDLRAAYEAGHDGSEIIIQHGRKAA